MIKRGGTFIKLRPFCNGGASQVQQDLGRLCRPRHGREELIQEKQNQKRGKA